MAKDGISASSRPHRIDVHHHLFPPAYLTRLAAATMAQPRMLDWTPDRSIEDMDEAGVATSILSITAPGFAIVEDGGLRGLVRECNDYAARLAADYPGRFGFFASLPLPDVDASLREIDHALDVLNADGIGVMTSVCNKWLGDPAFAPVLDELNRRKAVLYVHPTAADCCRNLLPGVPDWAIEFPVDTTRTLASLLFSGTVARCPDIRFIFSHAGGVMPFISEHLVRVAAVDASLAAKVPNGVLSELKRFHYDTALRAHPTMLASILQLLSVSQLLFGTDAPLRVSQAQVQGLLDYGFSEGELRAIDCENARRLLPRCRDLARG
jgi:predicted TIM-barrel fold metal-dependent hydrolase